MIKQTGQPWDKPEDDILGKHTSLMGKIEKPTQAPLPT